MLKRQIALLGVWLAFWSGFAADQLLITIVDPIQCALGSAQGGMAMLALL